MAQSWNHHTWRRETSLKARRDKLILHIEEVEDKLAGFSFIGGLGGQQGRKFELMQYRDSLNGKLEKLEDRLGIGDHVDTGPRFVSMRPGR